MRDCPDQLVRDYHVREGEHEEDDDIKNDVSLLGVITHRTDVDGMTLRDPHEQHRHALVADVCIWTGGDHGLRIGLDATVAVAPLGFHIDALGRSRLEPASAWIG